MKKESTLIISPTKSVYESFRGKIDKDIIIVYKTGRVVFTDSPLMNRIVSLSLKHSLPTEPTLSILYLGSDEAGKGELLGPLVVAAIALNEKSSLSLRQNGVMDSKRLGADKLQKLDQAIRKEAKAYSIVTISPLRFSQLHETFKKERKTLNDLLAWAHTRVIRDTLKKLGYDSSPPEEVRIIIDEFDKKAMQKQLNQVPIFEKIKILQKHHGEQFTCVAAASILARVSYLKWINSRTLKSGKPLSKLSNTQILDLPMEEKKQVLKMSYKTGN